jgi:hypothetical protein
MADEKVTQDLTFPQFGVDRSFAHGQQRPKTTPDAMNVRAFEPTTGRSRGGRRPGLSKIADQIPEGSTLIQHINTIVIGEYDALLDNAPIPIGWTTLTDPSDAGPPSSWGTRVIDTDYDGNDVTGTTLMTRNPGPRTTRNKGTGRQPNKNTLAHSPSGVVVTKLYQCIASVHILDPGPFFGLDVSFDGCMCVELNYLNLVGAPTDARQFPKWWRNLHAFFTLHVIAENFTFNSGSNLITGPVRTCLAADISLGGSHCDVISHGSQAGDQGP